MTFAQTWGVTDVQQAHRLWERVTDDMPLSSYISRWMLYMPNLLLPRQRLMFLRHYTVLNKHPKFEEELLFSLRVKLSVVGGYHELSMVGWLTWNRHWWEGNQRKVKRGNVERGAGWDRVEWLWTEWLNPTQRPQLGTDTITNRHMHVHSFK